MPTEESTSSNAPELSVSELSSSLKRTIEDAFGYVRVRGEISGYRGPHSSGHCYFCLKDEGARIDAVIWKSAFARLKVKPEEGLEVIATGKLTTFAGKSSYQIIVESIAPAGVGALMALLEERRKKLAAEGLFDAARKRPIPYLPQTIGVVTSPTGAVIRDILHRLSDRFPRHVLVWPVRVQGETSAAEVAAAIRGFNALDPSGAIPRPDVLIVARGGGSLEDLWGFNDEAVVRAAAESAIPLISAVGHETDTTLIDFAADRRAPTPTGAAEMAVPVRSELLAGLGTCGARLLGALGRYIQNRRTEVRSAARALPTSDTLFAAPRQKLDSLGARLGPALVAHERKKRIAFSNAAAHLRKGIVLGRVQRCGDQIDALHRRACRALDTNTTGWRRRCDVSAKRLVPALPWRVLNEHRQRLAAVHNLLRAFSYERTLERGFALVLDPSGAVIRSAKDVRTGDALQLRMQDGNIAACAGEKSAPPIEPPPQSDAPQPPKVPRARRKVVEQQEDLFG
ncbi:exodeoxyribonuclease VII large subunit [Terrihabitans sp. B22-R8]|uniref:exodeoxyribonuclease VII large subunit n=1 Tax=Terrihabitans sp. B22-R8 TaxID=3425128 RepID=UPI00403CB718